MNRPGYRQVSLNLRRGQSVPEHATKEMVTVYAIAGHITFYEAGAPFELHSGQVLFIEGGIPHSLEAHEGSTLLVVAAGPFACVPSSILYRAFMHITSR
ncbi:MAG: cupin domain-containing protein [Silvibacterium sp.]